MGNDKIAAGNFLKSDAGLCTFRTAMKTHIDPQNAYNFAVPTHNHVAHSSFMLLQTDKFFQAGLAWQD
jgi:hypothetical protein